MKEIPEAKYPPPPPPPKQPRQNCIIEDIYNYGKVFVDACNYANITEEQGLKFLERFSRFRKSE